MPLCLRVRERRTRQMPSGPKSFAFGLAAATSLMSWTARSDDAAEEQEAVRAGGLHPVGVASGSSAAFVSMPVLPAIFEALGLGDELDDARRGPARRPPCRWRWRSSCSRPPYCWSPAPRPGCCRAGRCARRCACRSGSTCPARPCSVPGSLVVRPDVRVRRRDLQDAGLVEDRDRDRRGARVELADVGHGGRVRAALRALAAVWPGSHLPACAVVVERRVLDRVVAGLVAGLSSASFMPLTTPWSAPSRRP